MKEKLKIQNNRTSIDKWMIQLKPNLLIQDINGLEISDENEVKRLMELLYEYDETYRLLCDIRKKYLPSIAKYFNRVPHEIHTSNPMGNISDAIDYIKHGWLSIDFDVFLPEYGENLQREYCWSLKQKQELIRSIMKGIYIPPVAFIQCRFFNDASKRNKLELQVIDGKQRISSVIDFVENKFPLNENGKKYYFKDLDCMTQNDILLFSFKAVWISSADYDPVSDDDKLDWYDSLNYYGTPQEKTHIEKIRNKKTQV